MSSDEYDFQGKILNFIQVGLGTNSTFVQNLGGDKKDWDASIWSLLKAASEVRPHHVRGLAIEPISELVDALRHCMDQLPGVRLIEAALGEWDSADVEIQAVTPEYCKSLLEKVEPDRRAQLSSDLQYLINMSCIGHAHPYARAHFAKIKKIYNIDVDVQPRKAEVWTYDRLARTFNFEGCEVLLIDTEGNDCAILRSMLHHCRRNPRAWPHVIQFESMGLCDNIEGEGAEHRMVRRLQNEGYQLVNWSYWNSHLVHRRALRVIPRLRHWVHSWYCTSCLVRDDLPFYSNHHGIFCRACIQKFYKEEWSKTGKRACLKPATGDEPASKRVKLTPRKDCPSAYV
jgi:hypothetical protein